MEEKLDPGQFGVTPALFREWRAPRFGNDYPQKLKSNVWEWLVHSRLSGYASTQMMNGPSPVFEGPTWSFDRFGQSVTELSDGSRIYIGGEHEDHYDPDFYIYNDVVVTGPEGSVDFYCYRKSDFPPTDFHTATLAGEQSSSEAWGIWESETLKLHNSICSAWGTSKFKSSKVRGSLRGGSIAILRLSAQIVIPSW